MVESNELSDLAREFAEATRTLHHKKMRPQIRIPGLTDAESRAMIALHFMLAHTTTGITAGMLGKHLGLSASATSQLIKSLEEKGLVSRAMGKTDSRKVVLTLTDRGADLTEAAHKELFRLMNIFIDRVGHDEIRETIRLIEKIQTVLTQMVADGLIDEKPAHDRFPPHAKDEERG